MKNFSMDKLLKAIDLTFESRDDMPSDFDATLAYLVCSATHANQGRNGKMFLDYYLTDISYRELGEKYGLSCERARQIIKYIERRLRTCQSRRYLREGLRACYESKVEDGRKKGYEQGYEFGFAKGFDEGADSDKRADKLSEIEISNLNEIKINEACPSVRLYNALYRAGYTTIGSIVSAGAKKVLKTRNFGKKCYDELVEILVKKYGVNESKWLVAE